MDVDDAARHFLAQPFRQDLHVARQHDEFGACIAHHLQYGRLGFRFRLRRDANVVKGNILVHHLLLVL
ncbi:hypothetical protein D3C77_786540 [compost metagenome]